MKNILSHNLGMILLPGKLMIGKIDFSRIRLGCEMGTKNCKALILFGISYMNVTSSILWHMPGASLFI